MTVILFFIILAILVLIHECGHFIVAKLSGIRVDEFGLGFPPRLLGKKIGETVYSLNIIPFGGFVKIFGEDPNEESLTGPDSARSFANKNRGIQALVLVAGVSFNFLFAWFLISCGFMAGLPTSTSDLASQGKLDNVRLTVTSVVPSSPAEKAGMKAGDVLTSLQAGTDQLSSPHPESVQLFIENHQNSSITLVFERGKETLTSSITPASGISSGKKTIGIAMDEVGTLRLPFFQALSRGGEMTIGLSEAIALGFFDFISQLFHGKASLSELSGPVGIAGLVGDARALGFIYIVTFTAFISINLAVLNLMPFPALDGGRLLFVLIEALTRRPIKPNVANLLNSVGFALLICLMLLVTYRDIVKLF